RKSEAEMRMWVIPMNYVGAAVLAGFTLPRLEHAYLASYNISMSVGSAQAYLSAAASGMMALTAIVFAMAFVMVQFSAIAYSPRLVLWFGRDPIIFHALGVFSATFIYALFTLAWVDREGDGSVPLVSSLLVGGLIIVSLFLFSKLIQRLGDLQISNVLHTIGDRGRAVIRELFPQLPENALLADETAGAAVDDHAFGPVMLELRYSGPPRTIARINTDALVKLAQGARATIVMLSAVGDTLVEDTPLLRVRGKGEAIRDDALLRTIELRRERTFEQDPKYPIRLLVDVAIKALSPAINDPTTAVQTIDQIEDLLRRLGGSQLAAGVIKDADGIVRLVLPMPSWDDYLTLAFDEIRLYGVTSVQVMRRMRSALVSLARSPLPPARVERLRKYLAHLDAVIAASPLDLQDRSMASQEDRQGIGMSRRS
ncbi:DUF2254 domain-containing protein, partial [Rhodoblastus sp.]|uniref:DUF2254 domain-containing protein n=1 Tax=Rhodoblastus sp. TaxID=1962975 RepID=UPI003F98EF83